MLRRPQALLILDNCEHVIDACAQVVETPLRACAHLRYLATSREVLRVPGEAVWRVASLSVADPQSLAHDGNNPRRGAGPLDAEAARLFVDRARLLMP